MDDDTFDTQARQAMEADAAEMADRDTQNWANHLEVHTNNVAHAQTMAKRNLALAHLWHASARLLSVAAFTLFWATVLGVLHVTLGWF